MSGRLPRGLLVNKQRSCEIFGWTRERFDQLVRDGMPLEQRPQDKGGEYLLHTAEVARWLVNRGSNEPNRDDHAAALNLERTRLASLQADQVSLKNATLRGELLPAAEAVEAWQAAIARARGLLLGLPGACSDELVALAGQGPGPVRDFLADRVHEALSELARTDPDPDDEPDKGGAGEGVGALGAAA